MKRAVSTGLMAVYWVALPLFALITAGLALVVSSPGSQTTSGQPVWLALPISSAMTIMIIWRLWTHERARRMAPGSTEVPRNNDD